LNENQESKSIHRDRHPSRDDVRPSQNAEPQPGHHERIRSRIERVTLEGAAIRIALARKDNEEQDSDVLTIVWAAPSPYRRREIIQGTSTGSSAARPLPTSARLVLVKALRKAHRWLDELLTDSKQTIDSIAARESKSERSIRMTLSLAFLSPDLIKAAIDGRLPRGFGLTRLTDLPIAWSDQWAALRLKAPVRT
jgi:site-specific DNA recombinase